MSKRVLFLVMPFLTLRRPHLGVGLLKAGLDHRGVECDVRYFNFEFADIIGTAVYERIAENSPAHHMPGEFVFTPALYGEEARPFFLGHDRPAGAFQAAHRAVRVEPDHQHIAQAFALFNDR